MSNLVQHLEEWLKEKEGERLEFKSARYRYDFEQLTRYCVALANEGGGKVILGVSDERPRHVVGRPDFSGTDQYTVSLTLNGRMQNPAFVRYIRQFDANKLDSLSTDDWLTLDALSREEPLPDGLLPRTERLLDLEMIVRAGKGRFILNQAYYRFQNREEAFRRLRENEQRKELLERELSGYAVDGRPISELETLIPKLTRKEVRSLLHELRDEERVHLRGEKRAARWFPGGPPDAE